MADPDHAATMTVEQAGALLELSRRTAYRAAAAGHIPTIRLGRRTPVPTALLQRMLGVSYRLDHATPMVTLQPVRREQACRSGTHRQRQWIVTTSTARPDP